MVENDTFTYHGMKRFIEHKRRVFHALITQERTQQLELLIHLISNSKQALVICGPEGIGKSTLLKVLQESKTEPWLYCLVQGSENLSFEKILEQTTQVIHQTKQGKQVQTLSGDFRLMENQNKKIVLMVDNAGLIAPGMINAIIDYASQNPAVRVVFVLTHEELYVKITSDSAIEKCHLIEIPPLTEKQCGEFLHFLSTKAHSQISSNELNNGMIESLYRETQGIPGRIIAEFPDLKCAKERDNSFRILIAAVAGLVALALVIQWFSGSEYNIKPVSTPTGNETNGP